MAVLGSCMRSRSPHGEEERHGEKKRMSGWCEARRKEWAKHWQCDASVQNMEDMPWKTEELKTVEEALARLKECDLEKASRLFKATRVGCDGVQSKGPLDLTKETRVEVVELLETEQSER